jgi:hypothetical protein
VAEHLLAAAPAIPGGARPKKPKTLKRITTQCTVLDLRNVLAEAVLTQMCSGIALVCPLKGCI